ncbi:MAG: TIGR04255 family protein [Acidobacteriaceae bacterium]
MPLPPSKRVVFRRNPLFAVSAQMRFPPILRIQVETPAQFQEAIREQFPGYELINPAKVAIPSGIPSDIQAAMRATMQSNLNVSFEQAHRFKTNDGNWTIQLTQESVTMACTTYERWERFREKFSFALEHFIRIYKPPFSTMVGLRYQNAIERSKLGLDGVGWKRLLKPCIAAEFGCDGLSEHEIISNLHRFEFIEGADRIVVQHGMATNLLTKEPVYSIDNNLNSTDKVELKDVLSRLDQLNKHSGSLFRLCITEELFNSLDPISI